MATVPKDHPYINYLQIQLMVTVNESFIGISLDGGSDMLQNLLILLCFSAVCCYTNTDASTLLADVFANYNSNIRPGCNESSPLTLNVSFYFTSIKDLDESESKFSISGAFEYFWNDDRLKWNINMYGGDLSSIVIPKQKVWTPSLITINSFSEAGELGKESSRLRLDNSGTLHWITPDLYQTMCNLDVTFYPFDSQSCALRFYLTAYRANEVKLFVLKHLMNQQEFEENGIWQVTGTKMYTKDNSLGWQELHLQVNMRRRLQFYVSSLIMPVCMMSFLQLFVFLIPVESGERVGFAVTVLLAIAVYLTLVQEKLPEASEPNVSCLSYKLLVDFMIGVMMVIAVIAGLQFYHQEKDRIIPNYLRFLHHLMFREKNPKVKPKQVDDGCEDNSKDASAKQICWINISRAFDRACLIGFGFCLFNCNIVYIIVIVSVYT